MLALCCGAPGLALADDAAPAAPVAVMDKPRPDYDAAGIGLGDWLLFPALASTVNYDDNIFRSMDGNSILPKNRPSWDWYFENTPSFRLQRKLDNGAFEVLGDVDTFKHTEFGRLDLNDWSMGADGKLDFSKNLSAAASGYFGEFHEDFESVNNLTAARSQSNYTRYFRGHLDAPLNYVQANWALTVGMTLDRFDWRATPLLKAPPVSNADRNETLVQPNLQITYRFAPKYQVFIKAIRDERDFDVADDKGVHRSSVGSRLDGGAILASNRQMSATAYLGYLRQTFAQDVPRALPNVSELDYGADVTWYAAPTATLHLTASRGLSDAILPPSGGSNGAAVSDDQSVRLGADWEARHDIIVQVFGAYTDSRLVGSTRTDRYPSAGITARYLLDRYVSAEAAYLYTARDSTAVGADFADQILTLGLNFHI